MHRFLVSHGLNRLLEMDQPTGWETRSIETGPPGELVRIDIKKLVLIPERGCHKFHGQHAAGPHKRAVYTRSNNAVDA